METRRFNDRRWIPAHRRSPHLRQAGRVRWFRILRVCEVPAARQAQARQSHSYGHRQTSEALAHHLEPRTGFIVVVSPGETRQCFKPIQILFSLEAVLARRPQGTMDYCFFTQRSIEVNRGYTRLSCSLNKSASQTILFTIRDIVYQIDAYILSSAEAYYLSSVVRHSQIVGEYRRLPSLHHTDQLQDLIFVRPVMPRKRVVVGHRFFIQPADCEGKKVGTFRLP